jgi:hypothetical protein
VKQITDKEIKRDGLIFSRLIIEKSKPPHWAEELMDRENYIR